MIEVGLIGLTYYGDLYAAALVDIEDYEWLSQYEWHTCPLHLQTRDPGYAYGTIDGTPLAMHRAVLGLRPGDGTIVHHLNRNRRDNRKINLFICHSRMEHANMHGPRVRQEAA